MSDEKMIEDLEQVAIEWDISKTPSRRGSKPCYRIDAWNSDGLAMNGVAETLSDAIEQALGEET